MESYNSQDNKYFAKKEEKEIKSIKANRTRKTKKIFKYVVVFAIFAGAGWFFYQLVSKESNVSKIGEFFPAQNRDHIAVGSVHSVYNSNPPTGGWHYNTPAQTGIYDKEFPDEQIIHNLEHSHIWIAYRSDLDIESVDKLAEIAKDYGSKIIMTLRPTNDSPIALAAWQYLLKLDTIDEAVIRQFIEMHRGIAGPEKIPDSGFKDFRTNK